MTNEIEDWLLFNAYKRLYDSLIILLYKKYRIKKNNIKVINILYFSCKNKMLFNLVDFVYLQIKNSQHITTKELSDFLDYFINKNTFS